MRVTKPYSGVIVPMVTPFTKDGRIDQTAAAHLIRFLLDNGVAPFVLGTTGESASIPDSECPGLVRKMVEMAGGKFPTYAGISSNCLTNSVTLAKQYFDLGIDVAVAHLPSYYHLNGDQILRYYESLAERIPGQLMLYNISATTHMSIPLKVADRLSHHPKIVGMKDSERDYERLQKSIELWKDRPDFSHLIGWGAQCANGLLMGSDGIVPSTGNIAPALYRSMYEAVIRQDQNSAEALQSRSMEISQVYQKNRTLGESLAALKIIMQASGLCQKYVLPPLTQLNAEAEQGVLKQAREINLL